MNKEVTVLDLMELTDKYMQSFLHRKVKESWTPRGSIDQTLMYEWKVSGGDLGNGVVTTGS